MNKRLKGAFNVLLNASKCLVLRSKGLSDSSQSHRSSWTIKAQFTPSPTHRHCHPPLAPEVGTGRQHIYTSRARPALWHLFHICIYADRCTKSSHAHVCSRAQFRKWAVKICADPEKRKGTRHVRISVRTHMKHQICPAPVLWGFW